MLLARISLKEPAEEIGRQEERAGDEVLRALRFATRTCVELLLFTPVQTTEAGKWVNLCDGCRPVFRVEYRRFSDEVVVTADWVITAEPYKATNGHFPKLESRDN
jgi:hypothetical protein